MPDIYNLIKQLDHKNHLYVHFVIGAEYRDIDILEVYRWFYVIVSSAINFPNISNDSITELVKEYHSNLGDFLKLYKECENNG